jgi:hypothetical protein
LAGITGPEPADNRGGRMSRILGQMRKAFGLWTKIVKVAKIEKQ